MSGGGASPASESAVIWQGFRHAWSYNHRLNRLGSGVTHRARAPGRVDADAWHAAASGTGADVATFTGFHTAVRAAGVGFTEVRVSLEISSREEEPQAFAHEVRVPVRAENGSAVQAAWLNGFDLCSDGDADKLASFHLAVTPPVLDEVRGEVVLELLGALNVDCDSPECDAGDGMAGFLGGAALGGILAGPWGALAGGAIGATFMGLAGKLDLTTRYRLEVTILVAQAEPGAMVATASMHANAYRWDTETAIRREAVGRVAATLAWDAGRAWAAAVPTVRHLSLEVTRERGVLRPDTAMHLLDWDMGVRLVGGGPEADLDLFFRNWRARGSEALDAEVEVPVLGWIEPLDEFMEGVASHRDAGHAAMRMTLGLLQFAAAETAAGSVEGQVSWAGGDQPADGPDAVVRRALSFQLPDPTPVVRRPADAGPLLAALEHAL